MSNKEISYLEEKILVVIESNGKKDKIRKIFNDIGFKNTSVFSTKGRLLDLPKDSIGFNFDNFSDFDRVPLNQGKVSELASLSLNSDAVFIFTDDDIEGEVIAQDVKDIIGEKVSYRIRSQSISEKGVLDSLSNMSEINSSNVIGGLSRRIFDRFIGFKTPKEEFNDVRIGRVLTPVLSSLSKEESPSAVLNYSADHNDKTWNINIPIMPGEMKDIENIFFSLSELEPPEIEQISCELINDDTSPFNAGSALLLLSSSLDEPISTIAKNMQELYEDGVLSYPRTDSFYLSKETIESMKKMATVFGVEGFDSDFFEKKISEIQSKNLRSQESHEAIHILTDEINLFGNCNSMTVKEQILTLVARQNIRAGQKNKKIEISKGKINSSSPGWCSFLSKVRSEPVVESREYVFELTGRRLSLNNEMNPLGFLSKTKTRKNCSLKTISNDQKVLAKMIEINIGRPSTYAYHSKKIGGRFLNKEGGLNSLGLDSIVHAKKFAPGLINPKISIKIENDLHFQGGTINERVNSAIIHSGIKNSSNSDRESLHISNSEIAYDKTTDFQPPL